MRVAVDEAGHHGEALAIVNGRTWSDHVCHIGRIADRHDCSVSHGQCRRVRARRIEGSDPGVEEDEVGGRVEGHSGKLAQNVLGDKDHFVGEASQLFSMGAEYS